MTKVGPCPKDRRGERREGPEGRGFGRRGPGAVLAPLARQSRGCRERRARGPGPGHRTFYRTRPSLKLGQLPTLDTALDTAPHRAGHYNGHYFPAPDIAPSSPLGPGRFSPSPFGDPDTEPPQALATNPCTPAADTASSQSPSPSPSTPPRLSPPIGSEPRQLPRPPAAWPRLPKPPSPGCSSGCLSPEDCGGSSAAVEALLFCTGTTGTANLAGTGTRTRTRRPLSYGPRVQRAAGG